jgi:hypothetical protein
MQTTTTLLRWLGDCCLAFYLVLLLLLCCEAISKGGVKSTCKMTAIAKHQVLFAISQGKDPMAIAHSVEPSRPRFTTTTRSGMESVVSRLSEVPDRGQMAEELRRRKLYNTKTNISLGNEPGMWETDSMSRQKMANNAPAQGPDVERNRRLKLSLTRTNFSLTNGEPVETSYECVSKLEDPTGRLGEFTGHLNTEVKDMIKLSSLSFGAEDTNYKSVAHEGMELVDKNLSPNERRGPDTAHNKELKLALTRTRINFGDMKPDYISAYATGFAAPDVSKLQTAALAKEVKDDLRKTHFTFGDAEPHWETDAQRSQRIVLQHERSGPEELARQIEHNRQLKIALQRTNINLGWEDDYM